MLIFAKTVGVLADYMLTKPTGIGVTNDDEFSIVKS